MDLSEIRQDAAAIHARSPIWVALMNVDAERAAAVDASTVVEILEELLADADRARQRTHAGVDSCIHRARERWCGHQHVELDGHPITVGEDEITVFRFVCGIRGRRVHAVNGGGRVASEQQDEEQPAHQRRIAGLARLGCYGAHGLLTIDQFGAV